MSCIYELAYASEYVPKCFVSRFSKKLNQARCSSKVSVVPPGRFDSQFYSGPTDASCLILNGTTAISIICWPAMEEM